MFYPLHEGEGWGEGEKKLHYDRIAGI